MAYQPQKLIALSDNTFGALPNFLSTNPLEVKIVVGDYLAMENQENVKIGKFYIDITFVLINQS